MLKIVLLAYSRGMVSSRAIERACRENVLFMAISGDSARQFITITKFICELGPDIAALFTQVLMTCDAQGLIGCQMFAIDGVKLPSNASEHRSGKGALGPSATAGRVSSGGSVCVRPRKRQYARWRCSTSTRPHP